MGYGNQAIEQAGDDFLALNAEKLGKDTTKERKDGKGVKIGALPKAGMDMSEAELLSNVEQLATTMGWEHYHTRYSMRSDAGFPDLVLARPPRILFVELKTQKGKTTPAQDIWLFLLRDCNLPIFLLRPSDWLSGEIERILR